MFVVLGCDNYIVLVVMMMKLFENVYKWENIIVFTCNDDTAYNAGCQDKK